MLALEAVSVGVGSGRSAIGSAARFRLRDVSLSLAPGELLAVLGPNGAGKSTLIALLGGTLVPDAGRVTLDGTALGKLPARELARRRAVLPQANALGFRFRAEDVVALGRSPHAGCGRERDRQAVRHALERADADALSGRDYTTLSGGERQRVHLARVLAQLDRGPPANDAEFAPDGSPASDGKPARRGEDDSSSARYLLLDEPTAALDLAHQHAVLRLARTLAHDEGVGVLAVLHDPNLAALHADRVAVLERGRLRVQGTPLDVLDEALFDDVFGLAVDVVPHPHHASRPLIIAGHEPRPRERRRAGSVARVEDACL